MLSFIIAIGLLLLTLIALTLRKTYYYLPETELKRHARSGDKLAKMLYRAVAYGASLRLLLWILIGICAALGLVIFVRIAPVIFGIVVVAIVLWLGFAWMPSTRLTSYGARVTLWFTPTIVWLLTYLNPLFSRLTAWWGRHFPLENHTSLYERDDLVHLIDQQKQQPDNRISSEILTLVTNALRFDKYKVRDIVVPRKQVKNIGIHDPVGPILLDELHATGHTRFPVYDTSQDEIVGTLHLISLEDAKHGGHVSDFIDKNVTYLHENDSLSDALQVAYRSRQQLFVVVNSFDEYLGIVTLEDIFRSLLGEPAVSDFEGHEDRAAVAAKHPKPKKSTPKEETLFETPETVVE